MLQGFKELRKLGILGLNSRNGDFILPYNPRRLYPLVDDKSTTKELALKIGIAVPKLYHLVKFQSEVKQLSAMLAPYSDFVIKPCRGTGGEGVLVIDGREGNLFKKTSGKLLPLEDLEYHLSNILAGMYSFAGYPDRAIIEYKVKFDPTFERISFLGVPDIRIIIFMGVPVMSMIRLPTSMSDGRANLHQGAIGVGIDMRSGQTINAVWRDRIIEQHPDTQQSVLGVQIPNWEALLKLSARCYELSGLGLQGVDIVLDKELGPLILELNARPGLNIQLANKAGLRPRLKAVQNNLSELLRDEDRVRFSMENFGL